jgi:hypothetical protein
MILFSILCIIYHNFFRQETLFEIFYKFIPCRKRLFYFILLTAAIIVIAKYPDNNNYCNYYPYYIIPASENTAVWASVIIVTAIAHYKYLLLYQHPQLLSQPQPLSSFIKRSITRMINQRTVLLWFEHPLPKRLSIFISSLFYIIFKLLNQHPQLLFSPQHPKSKRKTRMKKRIPSLPPNAPFVQHPLPSIYNTSRFWIHFILWISKAFGYKFFILTNFWYWYIMSGMFKKSNYVFGGIYLE